MNPATRMMIAKLNELAVAGFTFEDAAKEVGGTYHFVAGYARRYGIPLVQKKRGRKPILGPDARSGMMESLYRKGETLEQIGQRYHVTRERIRQILTKDYGTRAKDGGKQAEIRKKRVAFSKKRDARCVRVWGCSYREYQTILKHPDKPTYAYWSQRKNADKRGIGWELNLWQWWKLWEQSGRWDERGRGRGYCMCRLNDVGPYAVDNVYIATGVDNMKDHWVLRHAAEAAGAAQ